MSGSGMVRDTRLAQCNVQELSLGSGSQEAEWISWLAFNCQ